MDAAADGVDGLGWGGVRGAIPGNGWENRRMSPAAGGDRPGGCMTTRAG